MNEIYCFCSYKFDLGADIVINLKKRNKKDPQKESLLSSVMQN